MSDLRKRFSLRLPRIHGNGLKILSMVILLLANFNTLILEKGILHLENYTPEGLVAAMDASASLTAWVGVASILRLVGAVAVPIFAFLLVEGFVHTGNYKQYLTAVAATALVSEPLYDYAMTGKLLEFSLQNPMLAVAIALAMLGIMGMLENRAAVEKVIGWLLILFCALFWVILCRVEYGVQTVVLAAVFYCFRERLFAKIVLGVLASLSNPLEPFALCGLIYYSGERNLKLPKYVFYAVYPLHLLVMGIVLRNFLL